MFALFALVILAIGYANAEATEAVELYVFDEPTKSEIETIINQCDEKYGPIYDIYGFARSRMYRTDAQFYNVIYCIYSTGGFTNDDGSMNSDAIIKIFPEVAHAAIIECAKTTGATKEATSGKFFECFQKNSPVTAGI